MWGTRRRGFPRPPTRCGSPALLCAGAPLSRDARSGGRAGRDATGGEEPARSGRAVPASESGRRWLRTGSQRLGAATHGSEARAPRGGERRCPRPVPLALTFSDPARGPSRGAGGTGLLGARSEARVPLSAGGGGGESAGPPRGAGGHCGLGFETERCGGSRRVPTAPAAGWNAAPGRPRRPAASDLRPCARPLRGRPRFPGGKGLGKYWKEPLLECVVNTSCASLGVGGIFFFIRIFT